MLSNSIDFCRRHLRKTILYFVFIVCFMYFAKFMILKLAPEGYTKQKCITPLREIRKSENLVEIFTRIADQQNFTWWMDYGALLGTVREGTLIPFDKDIDASFAESDTYKLMSLEPFLNQYGIYRYGATFVWEEDFRKMETGEEESVIAKMEFYSPIITRSGASLRLDVVKYMKGETFGDRIWWMLLHFSGVVINDADNLLPVARAPLRRFMPDKEMKKKMMEEESTLMEQDPSRQVNKHNLKFYEVDEDDEEALKEWKVMVPIPRKPKKVLENLYGKTWNTPIKWKVSCYF